MHFRVQSPINTLHFYPDWFKCVWNKNRLMTQFHLCMQHFLHNNWVIQTDIFHPVIGLLKSYSYEPQGVNHNRPQNGQIILMRRLSWVVVLLHSCTLHMTMGGSPTVYIGVLNGIMVSTSTVYIVQYCSNVHIAAFLLGHMELLTSSNATVSGCPV